MEGAKRLEMLSQLYPFHCGLPSKLATSYNDFEGGGGLSEQTQKIFIFFSIHLDRVIYYRNFVLQIHNIIFRNVYFYAFLIFSTLKRKKN